MSARRTLATLGALAVITGCGDDVQRGGDPHAPVSGARLALQKFRFDDGTEHAVASEFYDTELHALCRPRIWPDGELRCVPVVDDAVYLDAGCTTLIGLGVTNQRPSYFVVQEIRAGVIVPTRVFRAGPPGGAAVQSYAIVDGVCTGPTPVPMGLTSFFEVADELDGAALIAFHHEDIGDGRLGLQIRLSDDGLRVPSGLRDRDLGAACAPGYRREGVVCEPAGAVPATLFVDPGCREPAVAVGAAIATPPSLARVTEPSGCATYHRIGRALSPPVYRRDGPACTPVASPVDGGLFSVDTAIALPALERSLDGGPGRRLQRVTLAHGDLRFVDDRLYDTETGLECRPRALRDGARCLPASVPALTLFLAGCTTVVRVAEVPRHACEPVQFATTNRPFQFRPIAGPITAPLFRLDAGACVPHPAPPGMEHRGLGDAIDVASFAGGVYYGERAQ